MATSPLHHLRATACALGLAFAAPAILPAQDTGEPLELHFLDVGQGDATLIRLGPQAVLVDAGRVDYIVLDLQQLGVDSLVAAIASHNHDDHIGGMDAVLSDFPTGQYLYNGRPPRNYNARNVQDILAEHQIPAPRPPWPPIQLGDAIITVFPSRLGPRASENNSSLAVLVERGTFKALLTGDSEYDAIKAWLQAGLIPDVDVLKAAHHGARNGVTPGWLLATRPEVVIISVGRKNSYGHPDPIALRYYAANNRTIWRTDQHGTIVVSVSPDGTYTVAATGPVGND